MKVESQYPPANLLRRLSALLYDGLIIIALEMLAAGVVIAILEALVAAGLITYGSYADVGDLLSSHPIWSNIYRLYLAFIWLFFLIFFWTKAGQTVGMRAWKLRVQKPDGTLITPMQAFIRVGTSAFGLANLTVPFNKKKRGLHDMIAKTDVVVLPKV